MGLRGGTPPARLFLALCVWRLALRRGAAGTEEVVFGKVGGSILLLCRNVSKEATEVVWFQGDPHSFPPLFSSRVAFPPDVRFSLVDNSSLRITELRLQDEGNYTCKEVLNKTDHEHRVQLLVANPPQSTLKCWAETSSSGLMLQLFCSWPGGYPHPTLRWREEGRDLENSSWVISSTRSSDTHVETLNSSHLAHRKVFKCVGSHVVEQEEPACSVEIKLPSLESDPPQTCFVGDNVTLTCRLTEGVPAARLSWLRGITQPEIQPGGRFLIAQEGNVSRLTIQNCSQGTDGGCYVCKAQNPVGLREMFVCLTVKQPTNIVGVVGAVATLSLMAVLTISGLILYYNPLLCLRGGLSPGVARGAGGRGEHLASPLDTQRHPVAWGKAVQESFSLVLPSPKTRSRDAGDVLVLVDSEDDDEEEEKGEEDAVSGSKYELVNGSSAPAAYLSCLAGGDDGEQHGEVPLRKARGEEARGEEARGEEARGEEARGT
ncbi:V-set and immunoglobulin domain-containing protein 10 [Aix galericulata]|nr:V-set and immunoglobulin domain-containing protein 10 [Aix galericulata]